MADETVPTEAYEARQLMRYMRDKGYKFTHIKNETGRSAGGQRVRNWRAIWDARDGVSKGFPDFIVIAKGRLVVVELKRLKKSYATPEQRQWLAALTAVGIPAAVCRGHLNAIAFIEQDAYAEADSQEGSPGIF